MRLINKSEKWLVIEIYFAVLGLIFCRFCRFLRLIVNNWLVPVINDVFNIEAFGLLNGSNSKQGLTIAWYEIIFDI